MRAEGVHQRYRGGPPVLTGADLECRAGTPVVLAGANGSGKSTLLRIVAGCLRPTAGRVTGRPVHVGYLPDRFPALLRMPAEAYLAHLAAIRGTRPEPELLGELGFTGPPGAPMARLSKGNAQKVGLAQALAGPPGLLVLDEPWSGLDAAAADTLLDLLAVTPAAVLVTDHSGRAARLPDARYLRLEEGRVVAAAPPEPRTAIVLRCADPAAAADRLGVAGRVERDRLHLDVPAVAADPLLARALELGCSVDRVGPA